MQPLYILYSWPKTVGLCLFIENQSIRTLCALLNYRSQVPAQKSGFKVLENLYKLVFIQSHMGKYIFSSCLPYGKYNHSISLSLFLFPYSSFLFFSVWFSLLKHVFFSLFVYFWAVVFHKVNLVALLKLYAKLI